jgi:hypothetical protein
VKKKNIIFKFPITIIEGFLENGAQKGSAKNLKLPQSLVLSLLHDLLDLLVLELDLAIRLGQVSVPVNTHISLIKV